MKREEFVKQARETTEAVKHNLGAIGVLVKLLVQAISIIESQRAALERIKVLSIGSHIQTARGIARQELDKEV